jgi:hypothetical protein
MMETMHEWLIVGRGKISMSMTIAGCVGSTCVVTIQVSTNEHLISLLRGSSTVNVHGTAKRQYYYKS